MINMIYHYPMISCTKADLYRRRRRRRANIRAQACSLFARIFNTPKIWYSKFKTITNKLHWKEKSK